MIAIEFEPAILCLLASLAWAPLVYVAATRLDTGRALSASEMLWLAALAVAALPTLVAPALAAAGVSLRPAPVEMPPMALDAPVMMVPVDYAPEELPTVVAAPLTLETLVNAAGLLYFYGVLLFFAQWLVRSLTFAARVRAARPANYPELLAAIETWRRRLGVSERIGVKKTPAVSSVCVYGVFRPTILIPSELDARLSFDDLVMMCAHELAHVKRRDPRLFAVLSAARILFWFNPFVKRIAARAELAAEQSADALVLERGADRRAYAACFVEGLRFAAERAQRSAVAIPAFTPFDRKSRRMRLDAILSGSLETARRPSRLAAVATVFAAGLLAFAQAALAVQPAPRADASALVMMPVDGEITLDFGKSFIDKSGQNRKAHEGVDIRAAEGTAVVAPGDGVVLEATDDYQGQPAWGKVVVVDHGGGLVTRYAHLSAYDVKKGERVRAGEKIAEVGQTGVVTGPHLHFETILDGVRVDPLALVEGSGRRAAAPLAPAAPRLAASAAPDPHPVPAVRPVPTVSPVPSVSPAAKVSPVPAVPPTRGVTPTTPPNAATPVSPASPPALDDVLVGAPPDQHFFAFSGDAPPPFAVMLDKLDALEFGDGDHMLRLGDQGEFRGFAFSGDGEGAFALGDGRYEFNFGDGETFVFDGDHQMTPEEKKRFDKAFAKMRAEIVRAQKEHGKAMERMKLALKEQEKQRKRVYSIRVDADVDVDEEEIQRQVEEAQRAREEAMEAAEQAREEAMQRAAEARERALELAEQERERALERAEREREMAMERAERIRERKMNREEQLRMLEEQAAALAEAEQDIKEERARIEKLRKELETERAQADSKGA
ncbi:MAG: peptidoglycan DD-metalloendopeptidase family protein [Pseudomonadota bacterium]|nr:peptidoglycan DD-metalloendopeptidase family protein [Pseudomonadota bacterium]